MAIVIMLKMFDSYHLEARQSVSFLSNCFVYSMAVLTGLLVSVPILVFSASQ